MSVLAQFKESRQRGIDEFHQSQDMIYYIISKKWLDEWFQKEENGEPLNMDLCVNQDIVQSNPQTIFKYHPIQNHIWNKIMLPNLQEGIDYEILDKATWEIISQKFKVITIGRDAKIVNGQKQVNTTLVPLKFGLVFPSQLKKFSGTGQVSIIKGDLYVTQECNLQSFLDLFQTTLQTINQHKFVKQDGIRLFKSPFGMTAQDIEKNIYNQIQRLGSQDDLIFEFKDGEYLDPSKFETIGDCKIEQNQIILADLKELQSNWTIKHPNFEMERKCEGCQNYKVLKFSCDCKKVSYCTEECQSKDEIIHLNFCEKTYCDEEDVKSLKRDEKSLDGRVGLKNLGNTCFMNSGIQCLGNTQQLREYLISDAYKKDINLQNTLGTKGELTLKFAILLKKMWFDNQPSIIPISVKRAIGKFQPQFQGFQQHDSQELITFLLDGLNEDLCRIKQRPYIERKEYDARPDFQVAKESWEQFKLRNDSIIVDNLYGQYKSTLKCPYCQKISITFDPYLMVNVSIPQKQIKKLKIQFINPNFLWESQNFTFKYEMSLNPTLGQILQSPEIQEKIQNIQPSELVSFCVSSYEIQDTNQNEKMSSLKQKLRFKNLIVRKSLQSELNIQKENQAILRVHESFKPNALYYLKKEITHAYTYYLDKTTANTDDIHQLIFEIHIGVLKTFEDLPVYNGNNWKEYYEENILNKVYYLEFKSNQNLNVDCVYCNSKKCNYCLCAYGQNIKLEKYFQKVPKLEIEVFVVWQRGFKISGSLGSLYDDWLKHQQSLQIKVEEQPNQLNDKEQQQLSDEQIAQVINLPKNEDANQIKSISLGECLKYSQQSEELDEENTWFCKQCNQQVRAIKVMEIYKTPKILIFHLKRFKNSNKIFKSKLETLIDFPISEFDVRDFVLNHHLPQEFATEDPQNPKINNPIYYDLYAISNHFGGLGGGHYTAFAKNCYDNTWYNYDDCTIQPIQNELLNQKLITKASYVLFYRRRE